VSDVSVSFYRVLCNKGYFYLRVLEQLGYLPYFFAAVRKSDPFYLVALGTCVYILFCGCGFSIRFALYSFFRSMFLIALLSLCFDLWLLGMCVMYVVGN
jgi:hypothetical protein